MGLFDSSSDRDQDEVVIEAPEENKSGETRLGKQVETDLVGGSGEEEERTHGKGVDLEDLHSQNERIIELLEKLVDSGDTKVTSKRARSRGNRGSEQKTGNRNQTQDSDDESIGEGMNELL